MKTTTSGNFLLKYLLFNNVEWQNSDFFCCGEEMDLLEAYYCQ